MNESTVTQPCPSTLFEGYELPKILTIPTEYPVDNLGPILGGAALEIARNVQLPIAISAVSVLSAASFSASGVAKINHWGTMHIGLYVISILKSGERKSTADRQAYKPIREIEDDLKEDYAEKYRRYQAENESYHKEREGILRNKGLSREAKVDEILDLEPPIKPKRGDLISKSATRTALIQALDEGYSLHISATDEGAQFFGNYSMKGGELLANLSLYTQLYDGAEVQHKIYNRHVSVKGSIFSVNLMLQPTIAEELWGNRTMLEQGFLGRFLFTAPESLAGSRTDTKSFLLPQPRLEKFHSLCSEFLSEYFAGEGEVFRILSLEDDAKNILDSCYIAIETQLGAGQKFYNHSEIANRVAENMLRISSVLALFKDPGAKTVDAESVHNAGYIMFYHLSEAIRLFELHRYNVRQNYEKELLKWLKKRGGRVSHNEICQSCPNKVRDLKTDGIRQLLEHMEVKGLVVRLESGDVSYRGREVNVAWRVIEGGLG
tara:strand:- start:14563 stop:16038 length:1476 start_codon:yes stop_codon:yes gene_type:complete